MYCIFILFFFILIQIELVTFLRKNKAFFFFILKVVPVLRKLRKNFLFMNQGKLHNLAIRLSTFLPNEEINPHTIETKMLDTSK